jgi:hypothetical protein
METFEVTQPWVVYHYGRTHDGWWPFWNSTRFLGRAVIVCECAVCGVRKPIRIKMLRIRKIIDRGPHPARTAFLHEHEHPDRGNPLTWARPLLNPAAL